MEKIDESLQQQLIEPFPFDEIGIKIQVTNKEKTRGMVAYYVTSRAIQKRLDDVLGILYWRNEYLLWQPEAQVCGISIYNESVGWVTKYDGARNTEYEPIKGGISDAFKRAACVWGIGRYLYYIGNLWVAISVNGKNISIVDSEVPKVRKHYEMELEKLKKGILADSKAKDDMTQASTTKQDHDDYKYRVKLAENSGNSKSLMLIGRDGREFIAYAKKDSPGLVEGACIKKIDLKEKFR